LSLARGAQNAFAVTKALADKHALKTLSDFAANMYGSSHCAGRSRELCRLEYCQPGAGERHMAPRSDRSFV
jgi:hypothetical protein